MRYDRCQCIGLDRAPLATAAIDEPWEPFPGQRFMIRRCPKCGKPRSIDRVVTYETPAQKEAR